MAPVDQNQVPVGQGAGRPLMDQGVPPHPNHVWPANHMHHPFEKMCYKRARGPLRTKGGNPIRVMRQESVRSNDLSQTWFRAPSGDNVPDVLLPANIPAAGQPNHQELQNVVNLEGFFYELMDTDILTTICDHTNLEMASVRDESSQMSPTNANQPVFTDTTVMELKALVGCLIMSGVRKDGHLSLQMMFDVQYGALFYRGLSG